LTNQLVLKKQNKRPIYYMETIIVVTIGLAIFGIGFLLGSFIEGIRSNVLLIRMENAIQQQHIDRRIDIITNTKIPVRDEEATKDLPRYEDEY
jgi:hypothetical protein